jgi:hypothetical protein
MNTDAPDLTAIEQEYQQKVKFSYTSIENQTTIELQKLASSQKESSYAL